MLIYFFYKYNQIEASVLWNFYNVNENEVTGIN